MEYIRNQNGKDVKVILPITEFEQLQKKSKVAETLEQYKIDIADVIDLALVRQTRGEKSVSLEEYLNEDRTQKISTKRFSNSTRKRKTAHS